jgi:hypothetical protein
MPRRDDRHRCVVSVASSKMPDWSAPSIPDMTPSRTAKVLRKAEPRYCPIRPLTQSRDLRRRACGKSDSAFRATHLSRSDSAQFCRWNLVSALRAGRSQGRVHFFQIDLFPGRHPGIPSRSGMHRIRDRTPTLAGFCMSVSEQTQLKSPICDWGHFFGKKLLIYQERQRPRRLNQPLQAVSFPSRRSDSIAKRFCSSLSSWMQMQLAPLFVKQSALSWLSKRSDRSPV